MVQVLALLALFGFLALLTHNYLKPIADKAKRAAESGDQSGVKAAAEEHSTGMWACIAVIILFAIILVVLASGG
jgi:hypothetical protein